MQSSTHTRDSAAAALGYQIGVTYLDHYWGARHTVIDAGWDTAYFPGPWVKSQWYREDGDVDFTIHATRRDPRDGIVVIV